jgi:hypothetical protein
VSFSSDDEIESLLERFREGSLARKEWTHAAHFALATWHLVRSSPSEALARIREEILRFNAAKGVQQTTTGGYHETLTRFYVWAVADSLGRAKPGAPLYEIVNHVFRECGDKKFPLQFYTEAHLMSWEARTSWVEPDLQPLMSRRSSV